jgi:hypothetical protein
MKEKHEVRVDYNGGSHGTAFSAGPVLESADRTEQEYPCTADLCRHYQILTEQGHAGVHTASVSATNDWGLVTQVHFNITVLEKEGLGCWGLFRSCDNNTENGCETNIMGDENHCGGCEIKCGTREECVEGKCVLPDGVCVTDDDCGGSLFFDIVNPMECLGGTCVLKDGYCLQDSDCPDDVVSWTGLPYCTAEGRRLVKQDGEFWDCLGPQDYTCYKHDSIFVEDECGEGKTCCGFGCVDQPGGTVCYDGKIIEEDVAEYLDCFNDELGGIVTNEILEEGASELTNNAIIGIPDPNDPAEEQLIYLIDEGAEEVATKGVCVKVSVLTGPLAPGTFVVCTKVAKTVSTGSCSFRDAHDKCKHINETDLTIMAQGLAVNALDMGLCLKPIRKIRYVADFLGNATAETYNAMTDFWTNPAWDDPLRGDLFRDARAGDEGAQTLINICRPEFGYTESCKPILSTGDCLMYYDWETCMEHTYPVECNFKKMRFLEDEDGILRVMTFCDEEGKDTEAYLYEYLLDPVPPAYSEDSAEVQTARQELEQLHTKWQSMGWDGSRHVVEGDMPEVIDAGITGEPMPGNTINIVVDVSDMLNGDYLLLYRGQGSMLHASVRSASGNYTNDLEEVIGEYGLYQYRFTMFDTQTRSYSFEWTVPEDAVPGEEYIIDLYTVRCDPVSLLCGRITEQSYNVVVEVGICEEETVLPVAVQSSGGGGGGSHVATTAPTVITTTAPAPTPNPALQFVKPIASGSRSYRAVVQSSEAQMPEPEEEEADPVEQEPEQENVPTLGKATIEVVKLDPEKSWWERLFGDDDSDDNIIRSVKKGAEKKSWWDMFISSITGLFRTEQDDGIIRSVSVKR